MVDSLFSQIPCPSYQDIGTEMLCGKQEFFSLLLYTKDFSGMLLRKMYNL
jgi:hypothetical protein